MGAENLAMPHPFTLILPTSFPLCDNVIEPGSDKAADVVRICGGPEMGDQTQLGPISGFAPLREDFLLPNALICVGPVPLGRYDNT